MRKLRELFPTLATVSADKWMMAPVALFLGFSGFLLLAGNIASDWRLNLPACNDWSCDSQRIHLLFSHD